MTVNLTTLLQGGGTPAYRAPIREKKIATASQTVFTLINNYLPNTNELAVYINGVRQDSADYTETNSQTVTFSTGLTVNDEVLFEFGTISTGAGVIREKLYSTAGQTVVSLSNTFVPGINCLSVFINGVKQHPQTSYVETNSNTVTFSSPLALNDELLFEIFIVGNNSTKPAAVVSYSPTANLSSTDVQSALTSLATPWPWQIKTANYTAVGGDSLLCNTTGGAFTITLPASPSANMYIRISDYAGTFSINNLILGRNGSKIMGLAEDMAVDVNNTSADVIYIDSTQGWKLV